MQTLKTPVIDIPSDYIVGKQARWFTIETGRDRGKRLFYYDAKIGSGEVTQTIFFVHGNPESSYTFRKIVKVLEKTDKTIRVVAVDHIGFGLSDQAGFEMVDTHHSDNLLQLVDSLVLKNITLVVHDWGGPIGVGTFLQRSSLVHSLVILNSTVFPVPLTGLNYKNFPFPYPLGWHRLGNICPAKLWRHIPPIVMDSGVGRLSFISRIVGYSFRAIRGHLSEKEKLYRDMFSTIMNAKSSMRNVKQTAVWGHGYQYEDKQQRKYNNYDFYKNIQTSINKQWGNKIKVRACFGMWDALAREEIFDQWLIALPQLKGHIETYEDAGHFVEESKYQEIAEIISQLHP